MDQMKDIVYQSLKGLNQSGDSSKTTLNASTFASLWARICAAYPRQDTTTTTAEVYFNALSKYSEKDVEKAVEAVIEQCKWFPTIAEIVEEISSPRGCVHTLILAEIKSREIMLEQSEKYSNERLQRVAEEVAKLEDHKADYYRRQRLLIDEAEIPEAKAQLEAVKAEIIEQTRVLNLIKQKVKLMDQARILQADEKADS